MIDIIYPILENRLIWNSNSNEKKNVIDLIVWCDVNGEREYGKKFRKKDLIIINKREER